MSHYRKLVNSKILLIIGIQLDLCSYRQQPIILASLSTSKITILTKKGLMELMVTETNAKSMGNIMKIWHKGQQEQQTSIIIFLKVNSKMASCMDTADGSILMASIIQEDFTRESKMVKVNLSMQTKKKKMEYGKTEYIKVQRTH